MDEKVIRRATLQNVRLGFKNFRGEKTQYNEEGNRNFAVWLEPEDAKNLAREGWNVRTLPPVDEGGPERNFIPVKVNFKGRRPPKIVMISDKLDKNKNVIKAKTELDESTVGLLDFALIENADVQLNPYNWTAKGESGVAAYLQTIYATIVTDELDLKYSDIEDATQEDPGEEEDPFRSEYEERF